MTINFPLMGLIMHIMGLHMQADQSLEKSHHVDEFLYMPFLHYWPFSINFVHYSWFVVVWCVLILVSFIHILQGHFLGSGATVELLPMTCKNQIYIPSVPHLCYYLIAVIMFMRHIFSCDQAALQMVISVCPSVCLSHLFDYVPIILSSCNFQEL